MVCILLLYMILVQLMSIFRISTNMNTIYCSYMLFEGTCIRNTVCKTSGEDGRCLPNIDISNSNDIEREIL